VKLACSSTAFDELFRSGDLTQLEWLDLCAHELAADGAVFDVRHFPRADTDYLAQLKKMAADLGLTVAAVRDDGFFGGDAAHIEQGLEFALALGAPLLCAPLPLDMQTSRPELQQRLGTACSAAKRLNVTLAVRNAPHTFGASVHDLKRVSKDADSAWLRFALDPDRFEAADEPEHLIGKCVLAWAQADAANPQGLAARLRGFRGFLALDAAEGTARLEETKNAFRRWREAILVVNRT
jgi:hypothetical protein